MTMRARAADRRHACRVTLLLWLSVAVASLLTFAWWSGEDAFHGSMMVLVPASWGAVFVIAALRRLWRKLIGIVMVSIAVNGAGLAGWAGDLRSVVDDDAPARPEIRLE